MYTYCLMLSKIKCMRGNIILASYHHFTICIANYPVSKMFVHMGQSLRIGAHILASNLFLQSTTIAWKVECAAFCASFVHTQQSPQWM